ncbi:hypothetical protein B0A49_12661 [Cryomyces minteri]|uniref:PH domain-containing protein n=1 Tax=Cryomyces minteri TaxID=331657 RepID=A0A4U0W5J0_9PEZI|nr:hypothetical protein B0A49_12661 [Cryomyces minteri]
MTSSFLLILESAEELDSWMIAVRQEIEALGGKRVRPELSARQKADELARTEKTLRERPSHRYLVRRDPSRISVIAAFKDTPVPSPDMSTLDWDKSSNSIEGNEGDASSSASTHSSKYSSTRGSADTMATTVTSSDQQHISHQRYSARTSHTATSRPGPPEPPRSSSPTPSPSSDGFGEAKHDSVRDPTSLKSSYRRNPSSSSSVRRRSMQTLPTTREGNSSPVDTAPLRTHRHSAFSTVTRGTTPRSPSPTPPARTCKQQSYPNRTAVPDPPFGARSHSSPVKASTPSRIFDDTATSARPQSIVGALPDRKSLSPRNTNRRPFPLPVRPTSVARQPGIRTPEPLTPRRYSSLPPSLPLKANPSVSSSSASSTATATATPPPPSHAPDLSASPTPTPSPPTPQPTHPLRRPVSMRVHSSPSPTPLLLSTRSTSNPSSTPTSGLASRSPSNLLALSSAKQRTSTRFPVRMSLPVTAAALLPPPAPPPSAPLPSVPLRPARREVGVA